MYLYETKRQTRICKEQRRICVIIGIYQENAEKNENKGRFFKCFGLNCKNPKRSINRPTVTADLGFLDTTQVDGEIRPAPNNTSYNDDVWVSRISNTHNKLYYYNTETGETRWTLPPGLNVHVPSNRRFEGKDFIYFDVSTGKQFKQLPDKYKEIEPYSGSVKSKVRKFEKLTI